MTKQGMDKNQKKWTGRIGLIFGVGFIMFLGGVSFGQDYDWELLPWKLNLEELNRAFKEKHKDGQIQEDKHRTEFEFQYSPGKSVKVNRGDLVALISITDPSAPAHLYGYAFKGQFFGRVILFKDHPELFPESVNNRLKETFSQGRVYRSFGTTRSPARFEYKSDEMYVFTAEKGIFFYEPILLEELAKKAQGQADERVRRYEEPYKDQPVMP
ncbi:MAG: hypothetical protein WA974_18370 [Thermodesulfobacteriota bacterium]